MRENVILRLYRVSEQGVEQEKLYVIKHLFQRENNPTLNSMNAHHFLPCVGIT
jgi:hypothetical protein